jgi:hypothetical protein
VVIAGNTAVVLPPAALANVPGGKAIVSIKAANTTRAVREFGFADLPVPGGPVQYSPNGTILDISITDANSNPITTFPSVIPIEMKYNAADVGQSNSHPETLTAAYVIDAGSPPVENPNGFPIGTFVLFPSEHVSNNLQFGTMTVTTQAIGSVISVVTNPIGYVQTVQDTPALSSFDAGSAQTFGTLPAASYLQVVEPQIGSSLLVLDPDSGNYSYVDAAAVGPSGPPPAKAASAVIRGLRE